jgi:hypothetical protein
MIVSEQEEEEESKSKRELGGLEREAGIDGQP